MKDIDSDLTKTTAKKLKPPYANEVVITIATTTFSPQRVEEHQKKRFGK